MRRIVAIPLLLTGLVQPGLGAPDSSPDYEGKFTLQYQPIMCIVAPCPPGDYFIVVDNAIFARVSAVVIETAEGGADGEDYAGRSIDRSSIEGALWLDAQSKRAIIRVDRYGDGDWKP